MTCLGISAQNYPSRKELQERCKEIQNSLNFIEVKLDSIHFAQIKKLSELKVDDYNIDSLKQSNQHVFDGIKDVLLLIPQVYAKDTINSIALAQFEVLVGTYNDYCKAVAIGQKSITISDNFQDVIKNANKKISEIKEKLREKEIIEPSQEEDNQDNRSTLDTFKELPLEFWLILALNFILFVLGVILIISHNRVHKRLDEHDKALRSIEEFDIIKDIKKRIKELEQKDQKSTNYNTRGGVISNTNSSTIGRYDLDKLKSEMLGEIRSLKEEIERLKSSAITSSLKTPNASSIDQKKVSDLGNEQSQPKALKGIYALLQGNGSFKTYESDRPNAFFIIAPNSTGTTGEFSLKELTPEFAKSAIDDRNSLLVAACEIVETSANPKKIKVESFGTAEKRGNEWYVKDKAKISLID